MYIIIHVHPYGSVICLYPMLRKVTSPVVHSSISHHDSSTQLCLHPRANEGLVATLLAPRANDSLVATLRFRLIEYQLLQKAAPATVQPIDGRETFHSAPAVLGVNPHSTTNCCQGVVLLIYFWQQGPQTVLKCAFLV